MFKKITDLKNALTTSSLILTLLVGVSLTSLQAESRRKTFDTKRAVVLSNDSDYFSEDLSPVRRDQEIGFINKDVERIAKIQFSEILPFSDGLAAVRLGSIWSFINQEGEIVTNWFNKVRSFSEGLAAVSFGPMWGFINTEGEIFISMVFSNVRSFSEGLAAVEPYGLSDMWRFIDKEGQIIISTRFSDVRPFSEGLAAVKKNGKWGYIDKYKMVISPRFDNAGYFSNGLAVVLIDGELNYINRNGQVVSGCYVCSGTLH